MAGSASDEPVVGRAAFWLMLFRNYACALARQLASLAWLKSRHPAVFQACLEAMPWIDESIIEFLHSLFARTCKGQDRAENVVDRIKSTWVGYQEKNQFECVSRDLLFY